MILDKIVIHVTKQQLIHHNNNVLLVVLVTYCCWPTQASVFFPRGGSFGYLAALAMPLNLPNHDIYMAFNFEANYGLPSNDSYREWIDRLNLDNEYSGIGKNVAAIEGRNFNKSKRQASSLRYDRFTFYRTFVGYLNYFGYNGTACLLRSICEVAAYKWEENNGLFGCILKVLFMPTASRAEHLTKRHQQALGLNNRQALYQAELSGSSYHHHKAFYAFNSDEHSYYKDHNNNEGNADNSSKNEFIIDICAESLHQCPEGVINMISSWY